MKKFTDKEIIDGIHKEDHKVLSFIYGEWYPMVERMVINHGGSEEDAKDIFQDALVIIYRKIKSEGLYLSCKFSTYLYSISRKLWLQEFKSPEAKNISHEEPEDVVCEPEPETVDEYRIYAIIEKHINALSTDCQKIIRMHFDRADIRQISAMLGYDNDHYTMDRKYRCKQSLIKRILKDPEFIELRPTFLPGRKPKK